MRLTQDDKMIHTLASYRSDQPFGKAILPGRGRRGGLVPDAHGSHSACDDAAVDSIPIADEVARRRTTGECLRYFAADGARPRLTMYFSGKKNSFFCERAGGTAAGKT